MKKRDNFGVLLLFMYWAFINYMSYQTWGYSWYRVLEWAVSK